MGNLNVLRVFIIMQIERFYFGLGIVPREENLSDDEIKNLFSQFFEKFKRTIEATMKNSEVKEKGGVFNYRTEKYSALVSLTGGFVRTIGAQEITNSDIELLQKIFEPLFKDVNKRIQLQPHLVLLFKGDFKKILDKFSIEKRLKELRLKIEPEKSGLFITILENKLPIEVCISPNAVDTKISYCKLFEKEDENIDFDVLKTINFIIKNVEELNK